MPVSGSLWNYIQSLIASGRYLAKVRAAARPIKIPEEVIDRSAEAGLEGERPRVPDRAGAHPGGAGGGVAPPSPAAAGPGDLEGPPASTRRRRPFVSGRAGVVVLRALLRRELRAQLRFVAQEPQPTTPSSGGPPTQADDPGHEIREPAGSRGACRPFGRGRHVGAIGLLL